MSGRLGMGAYDTQKSRERWLESVGMNRICARCAHGCKQPANVDVVICKRYRREVAPQTKEG